MFKDKQFWINPFTYLAGYEALGIGLACIVLASLSGTFSGMWFPGVLDAKVGYNAGFLNNLAAALIAWLMMSLVLYLTALVSSPSRLRLIDFVGTQALARFPSLILALAAFIPSLEKVTHYFLGRTLQSWLDTAKPEALDLLRSFVDVDPYLQQAAHRPALGEFLLAALSIILTLLMIIWMVALMFNAYRVSANLKGSRAGISFTLALIVAEVLSVILIYALFL